jgi:hypothetical protein
MVAIRGSSPIGHSVAPVFDHRPVSARVQAAALTLVEYSAMTLRRAVLADLAY